MDKIAENLQKINKTAPLTIPPDDDLDPLPKSNWLKWLLVSVFITAFILVGYYLYASLKAEPQSIPMPQKPIPTITIAPKPSATCIPRPACLDATPRCLIPETSNMCPKKTPTEPVACTMEAKLCPDGSYVSRHGPNCEFSPCPAR